MEREDLAELKGCYGVTTSGEDGNGNGNEEGAETQNKNAKNGPGLIVHIGGQTPW